MFNMFQTHYVAEFRHDQDEEKNGNKSYNYIKIYDDSVMSIFHPSAYSFVENITVPDACNAMRKERKELKRRKENRIELTPSFAMSAYFHAELTQAAVNAHAEIDPSFKAEFLDEAQKTKEMFKETGLITKKMEIDLAVAAVQLVAKEKIKMN